MDKQQLLAEISEAIASGQITRDELNQLGGSVQEGTTADQDVFRRHVGVADVLYYVGGIIVFIGIAILVEQNWETLNTLGRILVTLGSAIAAYLVGLFFINNENTAVVGQVFYFLSGLLMPIGLGVVFYEAGMDTGSYSTHSIIAAILLMIAVASYYLLKKHVFSLFIILYATWLFYAFTSFLAGPNPYFDDWKFFAYRTLVVGFSYILLGYYFSKTIASTLTPSLYGFGMLGFLGSALALTGWSPEQNPFWEILFPGIAFAVMFLSVHLKTKSFLLLGAGFLMIYILKITSEYFAKGLGWPTALVVAGLLLIAVGYYSLRIKNRYLS